MIVTGIVIGTATTENGIIGSGIENEIRTEERYDGFEGEPRTVGGAHTSTTGTGLTGAGLGNTTGRETTGERVREGEADLKHGHGRESEVDSKTGKPSMMDKLNPKKDADHDGK